MSWERAIINCVFFLIAFGTSLLAAAAMLALFARLKKGLIFMRAI